MLFRTAWGLDHRDDEERVEPGEVAVEPVAQEQLRADEERGGKGGLLARVLHSWTHHGRERKQHQRDGEYQPCHDRQLRHVGPDAELDAAAALYQLVAERRVEELSRARGDQRPGEHRDE